MSWAGRIQVALSVAMFFTLPGLSLADEVSIPIAQAPCECESGCCQQSPCANNACVNDACNTCGEGACDDCGCNQHRLSCPCKQLPTLSCCYEPPTLTCHSCSCDDDRHLSRVERTARAWARSEAMLAGRSARLEADWEQSSAMLPERHARAQCDWEKSDALYFGSPTPAPVESVPEGVYDEIDEEIPPFAPLEPATEPMLLLPSATVHPAPPPRLPPDA